MKRRDDGRRGSSVASLLFRGAVISGIIFQVFVVIVGVGLLINYDNYADDLVSPAVLNVNAQSAGAKIYDRNGNLLYEFIDDKGIRNPVPLESMSPALLAATIATEDSSFYSNAGLNVTGLSRAVLENLNPLFSNDEEVLDGSGGSSITQQLVKNLYIPEDQRQERSLDRKIREAVFSLELTKNYEKSQILEWYLNQISYGRIYTGVEAASRAYFGKSASDLNLAEAATLAGLPQSPAQYDPVSNPEAALARRNQVLDLMSKLGSIQIGENETYVVDPREVKEARLLAVEIRAPGNPVRAPHFVFSYVQPQLEQLVGRDAMLHGGLIVTTSLDVDLQEDAEATLNKWIEEFEELSNTHNGASVVIEPGTGEVLVMIGSRDYWREDIDGNINNLFALNSPGSTFKPFVYMTAFARLGWTPSTMIEDKPEKYKEIDGSVFEPTNPSGEFRGKVSLRNALGSSLNVPAFNAAREVGVPAILEFARSAGFTSLNGQYGPSLATGGIDLKAFDLAYGYSVIANEGVMAGQDTFAPEAKNERAINPIGILKVEGSQGNVLFDIDDHRVEHRAIDRRYTRMITDVLSDGQAECMTFGCNGLAIPGHDEAGVKTGTSEPFDPEGPDAGKIGETWAFGYTSDYVVGVWAGNSDNDPITNIYSTSIAFRSMRDILLSAYEHRAAEQNAGVE